LERLRCNDSHSLRHDASCRSSPSTCQPQVRCPSQQMVNFSHESTDRLTPPAIYGIICMLRFER
jgi:hypothetical protein